MKKIILSAFVALAASLMFMGCGSGSNVDIEEVINEANKSMPNNIDIGLVCEKLELDGKYVTYVIITDETMYDVSLIGENYDECKANILADFNSSEGDDIRAFKDVCKQSGCGIAYRYVGNTTGNTVTIKIEPNEF